MTYNVGVEADRDVLARSGPSPKQAKVAPFGLALTRPGQNGRLTFSGIVGTLLSLQVRSVVTTPVGQGILVVVYQPDGVLLTAMHLTGTGQTLVLPALPVTGTYAVFVEPEAAYQGAATASMEVLLNPR